MANANISQYHKYIDLQNVSGSGDPSSAPNGGIYLFASGTVGNAKLYLQNEGETSPLSLADAGTLTVSADSGDNQVVNLASETLTFTGGTGVDTAVASDTVTFSLDLNELSAAAVAVAADSIAIIDADDNSSKKESIADLMTAVAGDGLAASSGVLAVQVGTNKGLALTSDKLEITGSAVAAADIAVASDSFMFFDSDGSVKEESFADYATAIAGNGLAASSGVLAVGVDDATIELNSDALRVKDGGIDADALASSVAGNGLAGGAGTALSLDLNELSAADVAVGADSIAIVDATDNSSKKESIADLATAMAGDGLAASGGVFAVGVDDSTVELNSDALRVKADGINSQHIALGALDAEHYSSGSIENGHLAGSIANAKLSNSAVTVTAGDGLKDGGSVALGASVTLNVDVSEFAGTGLEDDGSENLRIATSAAGVGLTGGGGSALALDLNELGDTPMSLGADSIVFIDADDNSSKKEAFADVVTNMAGAGLAVASGVLSVDMNELPDVQIASGDAVIFVDGTDNVTRKDTIDDIATFMAGNGLEAASGVLALDLNELSAAAVNVGADSIAIIDADDSSNSKKESIADLATAMAGDGLAASSGVFAVQVGTNKGLALTSDKLEITGSAVAAGNVAVGEDSFMFFDADGSLKEDSFADYATAIAGSGLAASSGVLAVGVDDSSIEIDSDALRIKASGITSAMIADGAIVNADVNASAAIEATKLNFNVDLGGDITFGNQSDDTVAFGGPVRVNGNAIKDSAGNTVIGFNGSGDGGFTANFTVGGGYGSTGLTLGAAGTLQMDGNLTVGSDGSGSNLKVFGADANEFMQYDATNNHLEFNDSDSNAILEVGHTTNGFAIEVAAGMTASDRGKIKAHAFVTYSDETLKKDIKVMDNALETVMSLTGVEFSWKNSDKKDFGFIAQEVKSVLPQAVSTGQDGISGVDYSRLTSVLVEAVKAQQVQIEELKAILKK